MNKCPFHGLFSAMFSTFLCFFWVSNFIVSHGHQARAEVLSAVPKHKEAEMCHEKIRVYDKLYSGMSCSAVGCEVSVNKSTIYIK